jgi:hypothetical protein
MRLGIMLVCGLVCGSVVQGEPTAITSAPPTAPTTSPTTRAAEASVEISPDARPLLEKLNQAYAAPRAVSLRVNVRGVFDVAGRVRNYSLDAIGYADGKGRFSHDVTGVGRVVQTDDRVIIFDARRNAYGVIEQTPAVRPAGQIAEAISDVFIDENPVLLMLIASDPAKLLERGAKTITVRDGALVITSETDIRTIRLAADGSIESMVIDYVPLLELRGAHAIKSASATLTYTRSDTSPPEGAFVFEVPSGAVEFRISSELMRANESHVETPDHLKRLIDQLKPDATTRPTSD